VLVSILLMIVTASYRACVPHLTTLVRTLADAATFCALGFAISSVIPNEDASQPSVNVVILPLLIVSGRFHPAREPPAGVEGWVGYVFWPHG
jgi:ABC-2 type transport system permease protein